MSTDPGSIVIVGAGQAGGWARTHSAQRRLRRQGGADRRRSAPAV
ncbi:hypothetical protein ACTMU2_14710 [Cupriavidus basilensis]